MKSWNGGTRGVAEAVAFVLDASMTIAWIIPEQGSAVAQGVFAKLADEEAFVPAIWWFEIRNVLVVAERKGRIAETIVTRYLSQLGRLAIHADTDVDEPAILGLARNHRLTVYDAAYLALAQRRRLPIATLDRALLSAAAAVGIAAL